MNLNTQNEKSLLLCLTCVLVVILGLSLLFLKFNPKSPSKDSMTPSDCYSKEGLAQDQCIFMLAAEEQNQSICVEIENCFVRDVCNLDVVTNYRRDKVIP